jgi:hypothetical protein
MKHTLTSISFLLVALSFSAEAMQTKPKEGKSNKKEIRSKTKDLNNIFFEPEGKDNAPSTQVLPSVVLPEIALPTLSTIFNEIVNQNAELKHHDESKQKTDLKPLAVLLTEQQSLGVAKYFNELDFAQLDKEQFKHCVDACLILLASNLGTAIKYKEKLLQQIPRIYGSELEAQKDLETAGKIFFDINHWTTCSEAQGAYNDAKKNTTFITKLISDIDDLSIKRKTLDKEIEESNKEILKKIAAGKECKSQQEKAILCASVLAALKEKQVSSVKQQLTDVQTKENNKIKNVADAKKEKLDLETGNKLLGISDYDAKYKEVMQKISDLEIELKALSNQKENLKKLSDRVAEDPTPAGNFWRYLGY